MYFATMLSAHVTPLADRTPSRSEEPVASIRYRAARERYREAMREPITLQKLAKILGKDTETIRNTVLRYERGNLVHRVGIAGVARTSKVPIQLWQWKDTTE